MDDHTNIDNNNEHRQGFNPDFTSTISAINGVCDQNTEKHPSKSSKQSPAGEAEDYFIAEYQPEKSTKNEDQLNGLKSETDYSTAENGSCTENGLCTNGSPTNDYVKILIKHEDAANRPANGTQDMTDSISSTNKAVKQVKMEPQPESHKEVYNTARKRLRSSTRGEDSPPQMKRKKAHGIEKTAAGLHYQIQVLMYFTYQGYELSQNKNKHFMFEVSTEDKDAGKFDDVILKYKYSHDESWKYSILQVKCTKEAISVGKLLSTDNTGSFTLLKYFSSYISIKKGGDLGGTVEWCVIITNTDFEYDNESGLQNKGALKLKLSKALEGRVQCVHLQEVSSGINDVLKVQGMPEARYYKFDLSQNIVNEMANEFKNAYRKTVSKAKKQKGKNSVDSDIQKALDDVMKDSQSGLLQEEISQFLGKLLFVVRLPDNEGLRNIIKAKIGEEFCSLEDDQINSFTQLMYDYTMKLEKKYLAGSAIGDFFLEMKRKINDLKYTPSYYLKVEDSKVDFIENEMKQTITKFLDDQKSERILVLKTDSMLLTTVKIHRALKAISFHSGQFSNFKEYAYRKKNAFVSIKELQNSSKLQNNIMESFKNKDGCNLLVVVCDFVDEKRIKDFKASLYEIINKNDTKRIVFVTKRDSDLAWCDFDSERILMEDVDHGNNFSNLTVTAKQTLFDADVTFQGDSMCLKQLYFKVDMTDELSAQQWEQLNIDVETLECLTEKPIEIKRPFSVANLEGAYSKFCDVVDPDRLAENFEKSSDAGGKNVERFFVFSGIDVEEKNEQAIQKRANAFDNLLTVSNRKRGLNVAKDEIGEFLHDAKRIKKVTIADSSFTEKDFRQLCSNNHEKCIYWVIWKDGRFILKSLYNPAFLERRFQYPEKIVIKSNLKTELCKPKSDDVFLFTGVDGLEKLSELFQLQADEQKELEQSEKSGRIILHKENGSTKFDELAHEGRPVHWLHVEIDSSEIIWYKSQGSLDILREYSDPQMSTISEQQLIDEIKDKSSAIIEKPGMGKSTTLTILSESMLKSHWVMLVNLRDWQEAIGNLPESKDDFNNDVVIKFLAETNYLNTALERNLARHILEKGGSKPLLLLFDGFDEIRSDHGGKEKLQALLTFLREKTQSIVWTTAREHDTRKLQNALSTFVIKFEPLQKPQQKQYFKDNWRNALRLMKLGDSKLTMDEIFSDKSLFGKFYGKLSSTIEKIIDEQSDFMGIPLTLRLFAESFRIKFIEFICSEGENLDIKFDRFNVIDLYEYFIDVKFDNFLKEKTNLSNELTVVPRNWFTNKVKKLHFRLAFHEVFGEAHTKDLLGIKEPFKETNDKDAATIDTEQLKNLLSIGIIRSTKEAHFEFLHRTFAEYLASKLIADIIGKENNNPTKYDKMVKFLEVNILKESNAVIKKFLEDIVASTTNKAIRDSWEKIVRSIYSGDLIRPLFPSENRVQIVINDAFAMDVPASDESDTSLPLNYAVHFDPVETSSVDVLKKYVLSELLRAITHFAGIGSIIPAEVKARKNVPVLAKLQQIIRKFFESENVEISRDIYLKFKNIQDTVEGKRKIKEKKFKDQEALLNLFNKSVNLMTIQHALLAIAQEKLDGEIEKECYEETFKRVDVKSVREARQRLFGQERDGQWLEELGRELVLYSKVLTQEIATAFTSKINCRSLYNEIIFSMVRPLFYYVSSESTSPNEVDTVALLDIFQAFSKEVSEQVLGTKQIDSLLKCIERVMQPETVTKDSLIIAIESLFSLSGWGFEAEYVDNNFIRLKYKREEPEFRDVLLMVPYTAKVANLLILKRLYQKPEFEKECEFVVQSVKKRVGATRSPIIKKISFQEKQRSGIK